MELLEYLQELRALRSDGFKVDKEVTETIAAIRSELGFGESPRSDYDYLTREARKHALITSVPGELPRIKGTKIAVRDILNDLAIGKTVHQLCGEYNLDINQVSGAVIYAAYLVTPLSKRELLIKRGGKARISYQDGCKHAGCNDCDCDCDIEGGAFEVEGPVSVVVSPV